MKKAFLILAVLSLFLGACGAEAIAPLAEEAAPAAEQITGEDIQETAIAMAWTMAAETIAAMPTETFTPLPPTATFTPVFTETPIPTVTPLVTNTPLPTATAEGGSDPCINFLCGCSAIQTYILLKNVLKKIGGV